MIHGPVRAAVDVVLQQVEHDPTQLPATAIAALHGVNVNVTIDRRSPTAVVYVTPRPDQVFDQLSPRERDVVRLAVCGFSNRQIARALSISVHTVKDHVHAILGKTGLDSRAQLIAAWYGGLEHGGLEHTGVGRTEPAGLTAPRRSPTEG